jgi:hypothetical protein
MPAITGGVVIAQTRIIMPTDLATARPGLLVPVTGTITANVDRVNTIGNIQNVDRVNTIGNIQNVDTVDTVRNVQNVETVETVENVQNVETVETVRNVQNVETVDVIGSLITSGSLPVIISEPATVVIRDQIVYTTILASLSPITVSGTFISPSVDALYYPGGVGFSIAYIAGQNVTATALIQNSRDNTLFRTIATAPIARFSQYDAVFSPTRRYMRFIAINYSTLSATIDAVISLLPPGA